VALRNTNVGFVFDALIVETSGENVVIATNVPVEEDDTPDVTEESVDDDRLEEVVLVDLDDEAVELDILT
jgi:hypothetical protein